MYITLTFLHLRSILIVGDKMNELFANYIRTKDITFKHARGPSVASGKEFHTYHEIILFLDGDAELITESFHIHLQPNSLIVIPKETYHQVVINGHKDNYYRCLFNFNDIPALLPMIKIGMEYQTVIPVDRHIESLFRMLTDEREYKDLLLTSVLSLLLSEIPQKSALKTAETSQNATVAAALKYINDHLFDDVTIDTIAKKCSTSPSSLSHAFKNEMNIPLHRFIIKKRLIAAHHKIQSGESAYFAAMSSGFNDYSGFYKQYKKMFGCPPSKKD